MEKQEMWQIIKELYIDFPFRDTIFNIIENNLEKVEFVKDHIGLRDFLFIAEKGTAYQDELFMAIDVDVDKHNSLEENERKMLEKYESDPYKIITTLQQFFDEGERLLTVGIGFSKTEPTEEESVAIEFAYRTGMIQSRVKAYRNLRIKKFPRWYHDYSKMPEEVDFVTRREEENERDGLNIKKEEIMKKIDQSLKEKNQEDFIKYSKEYKKLFH